jgi:hypothetical protein
MKTARTMKNCILLFIAFIPFNLFSQEIMKGKCTSGNCENGQGTFLFENGDRYTGQFQNGQRNGRGQYYYKSGAWYDGLWKNNLKEGNGVYTYEKGRDKIKYVGNFVQDNFNGEGTLYYKNGSEDKGLWKDDVFMGIQIGVYQNQPVLKKGDAIVTHNNQYLLSQQALIGENEENYPFIPANSFILEKDIQGKVLPIGYITTDKKVETEMQNRSISGLAQYANNSKGHKFVELICDTATYNKFINYCNWEICRMINTANVFNLSYEEYNKAIKQDIALNDKIMALKAKDVLIQIADNTLGKMTGKTVDLNTSVSDFVTSGIMNMITGAGGNCFVSVKKAVDFAMQNKESNDLQNKTIAQLLFETKDEHLKNMYTTELGTIFTDAWHKAYDVIDDCSGGASIKLMVLNMMPELSGIVAIGAANLTIKFSLAPEYRQSLITQTESSRNKKQFLENYKKQYQNLISKVQNNCLEYTKAINQLRSECNNPFGHIYEQEELARIQEYVFGNKQLERCNVLSKEELKPEIKQPQSVSDNKDKNIIGYYKQTVPVYKENNIISFEDKKYQLVFQPLQKKHDKTFTRYYMIYEGEGVRYQNNQFSGYNNKNLIGWVDDYNNGNYKFTGYEDTGKIPGLNFFGSVYIGDNNPVNPDGTKSNFDLPCQDNIDAAALEHDKCYDIKGCEGTTGALANVDCIECDDQLSVACFSTIINNYNKNMLNNPGKFVETLKLAGFSIETLYRSLSRISNRDVNFLYSIAIEKERALLAGFAFAGITNVVKPMLREIDNILNADNSTMVRIGEREFQKSNPSYIYKQKQTITYNAPALLTSTSGEQYEAQTGYYFVGILNKDGKIEQGTLYDANKKAVKTFYNFKNK